MEELFWKLMIFVQISIAEEPVEQQTYPIISLGVQYERNSESLYNKRVANWVIAAIFRSNITSIFTEFCGIVGLDEYHKLKCNHILIYMLNLVYISVKYIFSNIYVIKFWGNHRKPIPYFVENYFKILHYKYFLAFTSNRLKMNCRLNLFIVLTLNIMYYKRESTQFLTINIEKPLRIKL
ncbi:hypothetical protein AGLY_001679 [Aphis glycines]|uniref:Uncharacterized protein n=1 Tax=Aphis glycines TaxID=307491 RepID=A0A6G0U5D8_APHGL|nr:hypothetical protein AGLY_001679 [Aphis glycines]